jgi:hypothetical protein
MTGRRYRCILTHFLAVMLALGGVRYAVAAFTNATDAAGLNHIGSHTPPSGMGFKELFSGGAAAGDYDNDGWVDLYITRYYAPDILYRNNGNGTFSDATATAIGALPTRKTNGVAWGDIDNDGDLDLYVTSIDKTQHYLHINDGQGHFTEEAVLRGAAIGTSEKTTAGTSVSFADYDNDGWLDMYVGEWRDEGIQSVPVQARLLRNLGSANPGYFEDTTDAAGVNLDLPSGESFSYTPRFVDFDRDGHQDIAVASDNGTSRLFWNNGNGTFTDGTGGMGVTQGQNDMGAAIGDVNGDGRLDWFTSDIFITGSNDGNRLFLNDGDRTFTDTTTTAGVRDAGWGWGTQMFDHDNDSDLDLIVTNGYFIADRTRFYRNNGTGTFSERAILEGITDTGQGRGLLSFDYDQDGDVDIFIVNNHQAPILYHNTAVENGNTNNWLDIETIGTISNRDGIGAFITVTPDLSQPNKILVWEITGSSSFVAQSEMAAHFGLGALSETIDLIQIEWPASHADPDFRIVQQFVDVEPNQRLTIVERIADYNGDGRVSAADYTMWRDCLGSTVTPFTRADGNGDGMVDELDYDFWIKTYGMVVFQGSGSGAGAGISASAVIPEPTSGVLLGLGALGLIAGRILRIKRLV